MQISSRLTCFLYEIDKNIIRFDPNEVPMKVPINLMAFIKIHPSNPEIEVQQMKLYLSQTCMPLFVKRIEPAVF